MGVLRSCVFLLIIAVEFQLITSQPIFESLICSIFCDDDDDSDYCDYCDSDESTSHKEKPNPNVESITLQIPESHGMTVSLQNNNGVWSVKVDPEGKPQTPTTAAPGATTATGPSPTTPAAAATTAATTPSAGSTTTAATTTTVKA